MTGFCEVYWFLAFLVKLESGYGGIISVSNSLEPWPVIGFYPPSPAAISISTYMYLT